MLTRTFKNVWTYALHRTWNSIFCTADDPFKKSVKLLRPFHKKFNLHHLWGFFVHFYIHSKYLRVIQLKKENMSLFFSKRIVSHFYYITSLCTNPGSLIQSLIIIKNKISAKEGHSTGFLSYYTKMLYDMRGSNKK